VYPFDLSVYDVNLVNDVIYAVHCLHIEDGRNVISRFSFEVEQHDLAVQRLELMNQLEELPSRNA